MERNEPEDEKTERTKKVRLYQGGVDRPEIAYAVSR